VSIQKTTHVELGVEDLGLAAEFHREVLGLFEVADEGDTIYFGCGNDDNYDIALTAGGTGTRHIAFEVEDQDDLDRFSQRLKVLGIFYESSTDAEPGQDAAIRFVGPSEHTFELTVSSGRPPYVYPGAPLARKGFRHGIAPIDLDHITLHAKNPGLLVEFLRDTLDFKVSDIFTPETGHIVGAWLRANTYHHDVGVLHSDVGNLHHVALQMHSFDHIKAGADQLGSVDIPIEAGPVRHSVGGNLSAYFWAPGGNRYELSTEMPRASSGCSEPQVWTDLKQAFSKWGQAAPETFYRGS
jgi:catechol 2,3-dioxygenase